MDINTLDNLNSLRQSSIPLFKFPTIFLLNFPQKSSGQNSILPRRSSITGSRGFNLPCRAPRGALRTVALTAHPSEANQNDRLFWSLKKVKENRGQNSGESYAPQNRSAFIHEKNGNTRPDLFFISILAFGRQVYNMQYLSKS